MIASGVGLAPLASFSEGRMTAFDEGYYAMYKSERENWPAPICPYNAGSLEWYQWRSGCQARLLDAIDGGSE